MGNSLSLLAVTLHALSTYYFGFPGHSSSWKCPSGWESKHLQWLLDVLPMYYCAPVMHPCLLQAPHGEQAAHLPALGRLSWASSQNTPCQLTQGFPWTGVRKPLCTLSIWSTLNEPYSSQTPQSDKHLHYGKKVAIFIFHSGEDKWLIQTQVSHPTLCSPEPARLTAARQTWQQHIPPPAAQDASLPGTPSTQTLVAIMCWAAALSLLLLNRQGDVLTHPWGMW